MKIALFCGGTSKEREVSFNSCKNIYNKLKENDVILVDSGRAEKFQNFKSQMQKAPKKWNINLVKNLINILKNESIEFVLLMLHGGYGEDGHIQSLLDMCNIPYNGSKMGPSYVGMNKIITKYIMHYYNIPTPNSFFLQKTSKYDTKSVVDKLKFPLIVKPASEGSTIGVKIVKNKKELNKTIDFSFNFDHEIVIEEYVKGDEMTLTVMNNKTYPFVKIIPETGFYDYERKYEDGGSKYICPAKIDSNIADLIKKQALKLYKKMNLTGVVRFDFLYNKNNHKHYFLEVNTLPGMTNHSLIPMAFEADNINQTELIKKIINNGIKK